MEILRVNKVDSAIQVDTDTEPAQVSGVMQLNGLYVIIIFLSKIRTKLNLRFASAKKCKKAKKYLSRSYLLILKLVCCCSLSGGASHWPPVCPTSSCLAHWNLCPSGHTGRSGQCIPRLTSSCVMHTDHIFANLIQLNLRVKRLRVKFNS